MLRLLSLALILLAAPAMAMTPCTTKAEQEAMLLRALQSEFMMAGVACNQAAAYNSFMNKFNSVLSAEGVLLKSYFARTQGRAGEKSLNDFITNLANAWSQVHMQDMKSFCTSTWERMWKLTNKPSDRVALVNEALARLTITPAVTDKLCGGLVAPAAPAVRTAKR